MRERARGRLRDGGLQPRPGHGPGRRRRLRRRGLHQPRPRPPRLPRRRGGLLRRQGVPVHPRARPARPGQRRRRARPAAGRGGARSRSGPSRPPGARPHWQAVDVELEADRVALHDPGARRHRRRRRGARCPGDFNVANALAAVAACAEVGFDTAPRRRPAWPAAGASPAASSGWTPARTSPSSSTTRTSPTRSRRRCARCARSPPAGCSWCSVPAVTGTPASGRSWARSRPASPTSWS